MAVLTDSQVAKFRQELHRNHLDLMKAEATPLDKPEYKAVWQAIEDRYENDRSGYKTDMDTALGRAMTTALADEMEDLWLRDRGRGK